MVRLISLLTIFLAVQSYAQVTLTMRLVERGTTNGVPIGEKVVVYSPSSTDTLFTQQDGYINGYLTDIKGEQATTTAQATTWITPQGEITNAGKITSAKLYNALGEEISYITAKLQVPVQKLANAPYFVQLISDKETFTLKFVVKNGMVVGATQHSTQFTAQTKLSRTAATVMIDSIKTIESDNIVGEKILGSYSTNANPVSLGNKEVQIKTDAKIVVENCDTDTNDAAANISINGAAYHSQNGIFNLRIPKDTAYIITAQTLKKDNTINSYKRTITKTGTINDTMRVVDFYLRDINNNIVDSIDATKAMTPERFKNVIDYLHFHNQYNGRPAPGGNFNHVINGYDTPNRLPEKIIIAKNAYYSNTQTDSFTQGNIDAIIQDIQKWIKPLIEQKDIPIEIKDTVDVVTDAATGVNYTLILPRDIPVYGYGAITGKQNPPNILIGIVQLNSNEPYASDPQYFGFNSGRIQELYTTIFGLNGQVTYDILNNKESVLIDYIRAETPTIMDFKIVRSIMDKSFSKGIGIDEILGN